MTKTYIASSFSDEQVVIADDRDDLSCMIRKLKGGCLEAGLPTQTIQTTNKNKSEYLIIGKEDT